MATRNYHPKKRILTPAQQFFLVDKKYSEVRINNIKGKLHLFITLQPTPFSPKYPLEIVERPRRKYDVWLIGNIEKIDNPEFPHIYQRDKKNQRVKLCLYHPKRKEWTTDQEIYNTIIPWACEWLYYYELWLDDGVWRGGGEHPPLNDDI